jgi:hypothetical protein
MQEFQQKYGQDNNQHITQDNNPNPIPWDTFVDDFEHNLENGKSVADNPAAGVTYFIISSRQMDIGNW